MVKAVRRLVCVAVLACGSPILAQEVRPGNVESVATSNPRFRTLLVSQESTQSGSSSSRSSSSSSQTASVIQGNSEIVTKVGAGRLAVLYSNDVQITTTPEKSAQGIFEFRSQGPATLIRGGTVIQGADFVCQAGKLTGKNVQVKSLTDGVTLTAPEFQIDLTIQQVVCEVWNQAIPDPSVATNSSEGSAPAYGGGTSANPASSSQSIPNDPFQPRRPSGR